MRADSGMTALMLRPGAEDGTDRAEHGGKVGGLLLQQGADVCAWRGPCAALCGDLGDLSERQPQASGLPDEREQAEHIGRVDAVAGRGTASARDDAARLVQAERFAGDPAAFGHVANEQPVHGQRIDLAAWVKVKRSGRRFCAA
jgi:hypothetical protein